MMDSINFNLANVNQGVASRAQKPAATPAGPAAPKMSPDSFRVTPDLARRADDYAQRHREAFAVKEPPKSSADGPKLGLSWKLDESTTIKLKPSLKKFRIELIKKF